MPPRKNRRGGGFTTNAAAAAASASLPPVPKLSLPYHIAESAATKIPKKVAAAKAWKAAGATAAAGVATAGTTAADVATIETYFGASGAPTARANKLPHLSPFQSFGIPAATSKVAAGTSTAPATLSVPTALVAAAAAGKAEAGKAASDVISPRNQSTLTTAAAASVLADDGESLGSMYELPDDISFSGGGDMGGVENEGVEEDAGVEGAELAALTTYQCVRL